VHATRAHGLDDDLSSGTSTVAVCSPSSVTFSTRARVFINFEVSNDFIRHQSRANDLP
jgi:hypothetical protein